MEYSNRPSPVQCEPLSYLVEIGHPIGRRESSILSRSPEGDLTSLRVAKPSKDVPPKDVPPKDAPPKASMMEASRDLSHAILF